MRGVIGVSKGYIWEREKGEKREIIEREKSWKGGEGEITTQAKTEHRGTDQETNIEQHAQRDKRQGSSK